MEADMVSSLTSYLLPFSVQLSLHLPRAIWIARSAHVPTTIRPHFNPAVDCSCPPPVGVLGDTTRNITTNLEIERHKPAAALHIHTRAHTHTPAYMCEHTHTAHPHPPTYPVTPFATPVHHDGKSPPLLCMWIPSLQC